MQTVSYEEVHGHGVLCKLCKVSPAGKHRPVSCVRPCLCTWLNSRNNSILRTTRALSDSPKLISMQLQESLKRIVECTVYLFGQWRAWANNGWRLVGIDPCLANAGVAFNKMNREDCAPSKTYLSLVTQTDDNFVPDQLNNEMRKLVKRCFRLLGLTKTNSQTPM